MRVIAVEEHFVGEESELMVRTSPVPELRGQTFQTAVMTDLGDLRLADMDAAGVDMQVLSVPTPPIHDEQDPDQALAWARKVNDAAGAAVQAHPDRFAAFAALPASHVDLAVAELERTVGTYGFNGALLPGHVRGTFLDDASFLPIFETAAALDVPIYLHPRVPPPEVMRAYYSGFEPSVSAALSMAGYGWHCETGLHALRLILSGLFDRLPTLQVIIGHLGETVPYGIDRIDWFMSGTATYLERRVAEYFQDNFYITTSGYFSIPSLQCALAVCGADRIMFAVDYPLASLQEGVEFLNAAPLSSVDREKIAHGNAERLLRIAAER